jgi:hypothetical protein
MNPRLNHESGNLHLSNDQMSDLLACVASPEGADLQAEDSAMAGARAHLGTCSACAAEFDSLRESLTLFQATSIAHADREFGRLRRPALREFPIHRAYAPRLFWVAASVVLMAGIVPLETHWQRALHPAPALAGGTSTRIAEPDSESGSDEALLEDINRELSASVPASMQALADPTAASTSETVSRTDTQTSDQRKD